MTQLRRLSGDDSLSPLRAEEQARLLELEHVVEQGFDAFVAVGRALLEIRDARLYRETHGTFELYCRERWGMSARHANRTIASAEVAEIVGPIGPANVGQARELTPLLGNDAALIETCRELRAAHGDRLTAELVRQAVSERMAREAFCREPIAASESALPETPPEVSPPSEAGGLYGLGAHRLLCGDATSTADASRLMTGERAALLFTSPPYMDVRLFGAGQDLSVDYLAKLLPVFAEHAELIVVNLGLVRRGNAVVRYWDAYIEAAEKAGLALLAWNVWDKGPSGAQPRGHEDFFPPQHEWLFVFGKEPKRLYRTVPNASAGKLATTTRRQADGTLRTSKPLMTLPSRPIGSVLVLPGERKETRRWNHPAVFPAELPKAYIEALTDPGDVVIDPFAGAGSTLVACELTGRRCYALELEPKYCDLIRARHAALVERDGRAER